MDEAHKITITICGDGGCGKSSITLRLVRSQWTHEYDPTIEDSYTLTRRIDGQTYHLSLTDTAGQEEYRGMWASSNLRSDAFLLVYDITSAASLDQLSYFNDLIDIEAETRMDALAAKTKGSGKARATSEFVKPIKIVAGNKCDLQESRQVSASVGLDWARRRGRERMSGAGKVVCVTGASGYIASWIVKLLLDRGYTVKGTVRSLSDPKKMDHLLSLHGAKERLQLFEANLMEEGSFDSVVDGCEGVFHTASPVLPESSNPQDELIKPAVKGTQNVLGSCAKVPSIKRVVLTSSMVSVAFNSRPRNADVVIDETWFSDPVYCEESKLFYHLSKTLAEDAAWKFARENGIDLVTINPGYVFGPLLQPTLNFTSEVALNLIKNGPDGAVYRYVDVRDVALAHILAYEVSSASGIYCLVGSVTNSSEAVNILRKLYPALKLPERPEDGKPAGPLYQVSKKKAESLGIHFTPLEVTLRDTVESLKEKNFLQF